MKILLRVVDVSWWTPLGQDHSRYYLPSCVPYQPTLSRALCDACNSADDVDHLIDRLSDGRQAFFIQDWDFHIEDETVLVSSQSLPELFDVVSRAELIGALKDYGARLRSDPLPDEVKSFGPGSIPDVDFPWCEEDHTDEVIGLSDSTTAIPPAAQQTRTEPPGQDDGFGG